MNFRVEQFGNKIGVDGNLKELIENKKLWLLLTVTNDDNSQRSEFIMSKDQAEKFIQDIRKRLDCPIAKENGFTFSC